MKNIEIMAFAGTQMELENIILNENKLDTESKKSNVFSHMWKLYKNKKKWGWGRSHENRWEIIGVEEFDWGEGRRDRKRQEWWNETDQTVLCIYINII